MESELQIGIAMIAAAVLFSLYFGITTWQTNRETERMHRAEKAAEGLRDAILATRTAYRTKRMPLALNELLEDSWATYRTLSEHAYWVCEETAVTTITTAADAAVAAIKAAVEHVPTIEELDADAATLNEQLEKAQRDHAVAIAAADQALAEAHERISKELKQIEAEKASR